MTNQQILVSSPIKVGINGKLRVPGDKSLSHRAVMLAALAEGKSRISGLLEGEDVLATLAAFTAMGVESSGPNNGKLTIHGVGMHGLQQPENDLDMGNSGTAMRLMAGILAAQKFPSKLIGDASLSSRPMRRVTVPLTSMGARCATDENGCPPIHIRGVEGLQPIDYTLPVVSAQVKSAVLLAGLYADGITRVTEPAPTRDHTERLLKAFACQVQVESLSETASRISIQGRQTLKAANIDVPADISSAAFFIVAASIIPQSGISLTQVGINPTRTGIIDVLRQMGADIKYRNKRNIGDEPVADIEVKYCGLKGIDIDPKYVPLAIDEFPVLCVAAAAAQGTTRIRGAEELRHKESDRISAMARGLRALGVELVEHKDGLDIVGGSIKGGMIDSLADHRIAMSFAIAGALADDKVQISRAQNIATSFPNFVELANHSGLNLAS